MRRSEARAVVLAALALGLAAPAEAKVKTEVVEYAQGDQTLEGYLAYDDASTAKRPGVMVVHEWTGLGRYVKRRAEQLAQLGYVAFAADIYGKGVRPKDQKGAAAEAGKYRGNRPLLRARAAAGLQVLKGHRLVDPRRVAAIGYCFGGGTVLELARSGADLAGVVSFHGSLDTPNPDDARHVKAKVMAIHGGDDPFVPPEQVTAFWNEMKKARVDYQIVILAGAVHGFTNPDSGNDPKKGMAYSPSADRRSWAEMQRFFGEIFH
ncbi:MAG TPA: dienelactone hydrolase family protein [Polyangia bacterium]|jgi:dienelactone hydrolase